MTHAFYPFHMRVYFIVLPASGKTVTTYHSNKGLQIEHRAGNMGKEKYSDADRWPLRRSSETLRGDTENSDFRCKYKYYFVQYLLGACVDVPLKYLSFWWKIIAIIHSKSTITLNWIILHHEISLEMLCSEGNLEDVSLRYYMMPSKKESTMTRGKKLHFNKVSEVTKSNF